MTISPFRSDGTRRARLASLSILVTIAAGAASWPGAAGAASPAFKTRYKAAYAAYEAGKYAEALAGFEGAYALEKEPLALYSIGRCQQLLGRPDEAAASYESFLAAAPVHEAAPKARTYLVEALTEVGEKKKAEKDPAGAAAAFRAALAKADRETPELLAALGEAQAELGDANAVATLERARTMAVAPDLRARIDAALSVARSAAAPPPAPAAAPDPGARPAVAPDPPARGPESTLAPVSAGVPAGAGSGGAAAAGLAGPASAPAGTAGSRGPGTGLWIGIGAGAAVVVTVAVTLIVVLVPRSIPTRAMRGFDESHILDLREAN